MVTLPGDFSFDALSPRGRTMFVIQYTDVTDPTRYAVRAFDLDTGRLLSAPVVDPHERGDAMRGSPLSRAVSPDGRWAYTLYDGGGMVPFVHALDTSRREARCIDVELLQNRQDIWQMRIDAGQGGRLTIGRDGRPAAIVDTATFRVTAPPRPAPHPASGGRPWTLFGASALATILAASALSVFVQRRRRKLAAA